MDFWMVTLNGHPIGRWLTKPEAEAMATRWQGSHGGYHGSSGLLKIKDRGDWVEIKPDKEAMKETNSRYQTMKAGDRQQLQFAQRVENLQDADDIMRDN